MDQGPWQTRTAGVWQAERSNMADVTDLKPFGIRAGLVWRRSDVQENDHGQTSLRCSTFRWSVCRRRGLRRGWCRGSDGFLADAHPDRRRKDASIAQCGLSAAEGSDL